MVETIIITVAVLMAYSIFTFIEICRLAYNEPNWVKNCPTTELVLYAGMWPIYGTRYALYHIFYNFKKFCANLYRWVINFFQCFYRALKRAILGNL